MRSTRAKRRLIAAAAVVAVIPAVALAVSSAASASPSRVSVAQGIGPAVLKDATPFGNTPPSTPEQVSFVLRGLGLSSLESAVDSGRQRTLSVSGFANEYGQPIYVIDQMEDYLKSYGISITKTYSDHLDISTTRSEEHTSELQSP